LNAPHPIVRRSAAFSLGDLIEQEILLFEAELLDMLLFLGSSARVTSALQLHLKDPESSLS
jgi:hypothetical protein